MREGQAREAVPSHPQLAMRTSPIPCVSKALGQLRGLQTPLAHLAEENEILIVPLRLLGGVHSLESGGLHLQGTFQLRHWEESRGQNGKPAAGDLRFTPGPAGLAPAARARLRSAPKPHPVTTPHPNLKDEAGPPAREGGRTQPNGGHPRCGEEERRAGGRPASGRSSAEQRVRPFLAACDPLKLEGPVALPGSASHQRFSRKLGGGCVGGCGRLKARRDPRSRASPTPP